MKEKLQKFGGAMFTPVMLLSFSGIILALTIIFKNPLVMGSIAEETTFWYKFWDIVSAGMWTVFNNLELLFAIALPIGLAKKSIGRVSMESFVVYMSFNYFIGAILSHFGEFFGVDFSVEPETGSGLKLVGGIKTLDTGILGAIIIALVVVYLHDHFFDKRVPDWLAMFNGSSLVVFLGMISALAIALIFCFVWPVFQNGMSNIQGFFVNSGAFGIWCYSLLERLLLPTGLHHLLTQPFSYGPVVVNEGVTTYWLDHLTQFSQSTTPLAELFPGAAFKLYGHNKIFGVPGVALAMYFASKKENRKKTGALMFPAALTSIFGGITEPIEFTFLFVSPPLYFIYAVLCATLTTAQYAIGTRGDFTSGLITWLAKNWIPLWKNHHGEYIKQILLGLVFIIIFFVVFYVLITKFDIKTPGRQDVGNDKLYTKKDYKKKKQENVVSSENEFQTKARTFLTGLGGKDNINSVTNCATRLRTTVQDVDKVLDDGYFQENGALGMVRKGNNIQVIVGPTVPQVKDEFDKLL